MKKESKMTWILSTLVCLIPIIIAIVLYDKLPDQIVTHWSADGQPNGWSSKFTGTILFPGILVLLNMAFPFILKTDPKYENIPDKVKNLIQWIVPMVALFASTITLAAAVGKDVKVEVLTPMFVGLMFVIIGNYLPKAEQSYTVGIKIPWTLADEENWNMTHRFAGKLWVVCGLLLIVSAFLPVKSFVIITLAVIMVLVPCGYSFFLYSRKKNQQ